MNIKSEKSKTRDVKYLAVAQWLRNMPDEGEHNVMSDRRSSQSQTDERTEPLANITIDVDPAPEIDKNLSDELPCNESSVNGCSTRPLRLHGNKCSLNSPDVKSRLDVTARKSATATGGSRRVKFDMPTESENVAEKADDAEKRVKCYDIVIRTAEEDNAELKRSMTQYLSESARKDRYKITEQKPGSKYIVNSGETEDSNKTEPEHAFQRTTTADDRSGRSRKSPSAAKEFDDVIFDNQTLRTATSGKSSQRGHSGYVSTKSGWSPGSKRVVNRQKPRKVYLKFLTGTQEVQTPVIKGLVIDVVENQKPSVIRASKNANIREEFALRQKVEGYRATCSQSINMINFAQRKLSTNLLNMKRKMAARAQANKATDDPFAIKTLSEELFLQSKGYFPDTRPESSRAYNFPPLTYPKRRVLTIC